MFSFEKLSVYKRAHLQNIKVLQILTLAVGIDPFLKNQMKRASMSIILNIAEGIGRESWKEKNYFLTVSRGSAFECVAILDTLKALEHINDQQYNELYTEYEEISRMLIGLKKSLRRSSVQSTTKL
jgi:four helix bundle protein